MFKYLFKALFMDDSVIEQNQEDKGMVEGRNCFYDVLQRINELRAFALYNQETGEEWLIDIGGDCHFEHNSPYKDENTGEITYQGSEFKLHGDLELENIRLIWFFKRQLLLDIVNTGVIDNQITGYTIGFQANVKTTGENKQFTITVW